MSKRIKYVYLQPGQVPPQAKPQPKHKQPAPAQQPKPQKPPVMDGLAWVMLLAVTALWAWGAMS
ncbi:hypothetical protein [Thiothrix subterranea]|uniref:Uncharacterized protein n=1 Tax=Thiothrix subterranea TaxID=2735563 RepID=A0AA51ML95_9GAMM|nr:hypothetical protein [Thiothrix subterranea]MDQ5769937.1 hypothetical protein [Thiothrix subterranea]WML86038.1 hypothetical protein RCG00_17275 [Thiothrix subterranea]